jgi:hypothetical protein
MKRCDMAVYHLPKPWAFSPLPSRLEEPQPHPFLALSR